MAAAAIAWLLLLFGVVILGDKKSRSIKSGNWTETNGAINSVDCPKYTTSLHKLSTKAVARFIATQDARHLTLYKTFANLLRGGQ